MRAHIGLKMNVGTKIKLAFNRLTMIKQTFKPGTRGKVNLGQSE